MTIPRLDWEEPLRRQARFFVESIRNGTASICSGEPMREHGAPGRIPFDA